MAVTAEDVSALVKAELETGRRYMLMETECFSATYLYVKKLYDRGAADADQRFGPMVDEFVRSILDGRRTSIDTRVAANWTMAALAAHESAMQDGQPKTITPVASLRSALRSRWLCRFPHRRIWR